MHRRRSHEVGCACHRCCDHPCMSCCSLSFYGVGLLHSAALSGRITAAAEGRPLPMQKQVKAFACCEGAVCSQSVLHAWLWFWCAPSAPAALLLMQATSGASQAAHCLADIQTVCCVWLALDMPGSVEAAASCNIYKALGLPFCCLPYNALWAAQLRAACNLCSTGRHLQGCMVQAI